MSAVAARVECPRVPEEESVSVEQRPEIEALYAERRTFAPDPAFTAQANARAGL